MGNAQIKDSDANLNLKIKSSSKMPSLIHSDYPAVRNVFATAQI